MQKVHFATTHFCVLFSQRVSNLRLPLIEGAPAKRVRERRCFILSFLHSFISSFLHSFIPSFLHSFIPISPPCPPSIRGGHEQVLCKRCILLQPPFCVLFSQRVSNLRLPLIEEDAADNRLGDADCHANAAAMARNDKPLRTRFVLSLISRIFSGAYGGADRPSRR